jgi:hypothetical protein
MSKTLNSTNGHISTNGNRFAAVPDSGAVDSLAGWANAETARVCAHVLFTCAMGDSDEVLQDPSAETLQQYFDAEHWIVQNEEQLLRAAIERYLAGVDWETIAAHVQAYAAAAAAK